MTWLELKNPPPIVALLCAIGMVVLPDLFGLEAFEVPFQGWAAGLVVAFGLSFDLLGLLEFRRHSTTVNPLSPNKSSQVVSSRIYRLTRNPHVPRYGNRPCGRNDLVGKSSWAAHGPCLCPLSNAVPDQARGENSRGQVW